MTIHSPQLIVALDNCSPDLAYQIVDELAAGSGIQWFKVGLELYTQAGPALVLELKKRGFNVFLDLKLYDIPNTVAKAVEAAARTQADLLTIHASGGPTMLREAARAASGSSLSIVGVTVLTSFGAEDFFEVCKAWGMNADQKPNRAIVAQELAKMACQAGLAGIVCSVPDLMIGGFKDLPWTQKPVFVTPGIRNNNTSLNDQKSVATVAQALAAGSTHLVVGRPITNPHPLSRTEAARAVLAQLTQVKEQ